MKDNEYTIIEIKISLIGNDREWHELPVNIRFSGLWSDVRTYIDESLKDWVNLPFVHTIRWNFEGSLQGHYIIPATFKN